MKQPSLSDALENIGRMVVTDPHMAAFARTVVDTRIAMAGAYADAVQKAFAREGQGG